VVSVAPFRLRPTEAPAAPSPPSRRGRRNTPLVGVGVVLVVIGALASAVLRSGAGQRIAVLVVARPVAAGGVVHEADLRDVDLSPAAGVATVAASRRGAIVGRRAAAPLAAGMVLSDALLARGAKLEAGEAVVPLSLGTGRVPVEVGPGDRVAVMAAGAPTAASDGSGGGVLAEGRILSISANSNDATVVSLVVVEGSAAAVMAAAARGGVGLVLLGAK
jgi:hypothetical protein